MSQRRVTTGIALLLTLCFCAGSSSAAQPRFRVFKSRPDLKPPPVKIVQRTRHASPGYVFIAHYGDQGTPGDVPRAPEIELPGVKEIPFLGDVVGDLNVLTWLALLLVPLVALYLFRTPAGLRLRSIGEKPRAADSVGLPVLRTRYLAVIASGCLAGLGGVYLSVALVHSFNQGMTAGRGFIALAVVIFGAWRPYGALAGACLFGFSSAVAQRLPAFSESLAVLFQALPYVLVLVVVAGLIGRSRPPAAIGVPYVKE